MLGKLIKKVRIKTTLIALAGSLLLTSGCATYSVMSQDLIQSVTQVKRTIEGQTDYSKLTWQEAIKSVQTPMQAQDYLDNHFNSDNDETGFALPGLFSIGGRGETFEYNHTRQKGVCFDYATVAAALLYDNGYPPLILDMQDGVFYGHNLFLYKTPTGFGALGYNHMKPNYPDVESLIKYINEIHGSNLTEYNIINFNDNFNNSSEWISGDRDLRIGINPFGKFNDVQ